MEEFSSNIEKLTLENTNFRKVVFTGEHSQLVLMSLKPKEDIGSEVHPDIDQFFRFESGHGEVLVDGKSHLVSDGDAVVVPAGREHNIINVSDDEDLKLYTIYSPPEHPAGTVHETKEDAQKAEH